MTKRIVLGIDPGAVSGWAIAVSGEEVTEYGTAKVYEGRLYPVMKAARVAAKQQASIHVAMEWPTAGGWTATTAMGFGRNQGRWLELIEQELGISQRRVIQVAPQTWRAATHGVLRGDDVKGAACSFANVEQPDAAEAACLSLHVWRMLEEKAA